MNQQHSPATEPVAPTLAPNPFGVYLSPESVDPDNNDPYEVSRTGLIVYPTSKNPVPNCKPQVISMVNGSMCINPLGEFICSVNFDLYMVDVLDDGFRLPLATEPCIAYFDPATNTYTAEIPPHEQVDI